jgi:hypothetical protein
MEWITRILIGLLITALGVSLTFKTQWYMRILGRLPFAEKYMGGGGTRLFYKLLGALISIIGIIVMTDLFDNMMEWIVGGLFGFG